MKIDLVFGKYTPSVVFCLYEIDSYSLKVPAPDHNGYLHSAVGALKDVLLLRMITGFKSIVGDKKFCFFLLLYFL